MNYDNDSIGDLDHLYGRGAFAPLPLNSGGSGIGTPTTFPRTSPQGPMPEGPQGKAARIGIEQTNAATKAYNKSGGRIDKMIQNGYPVQAAPQPNPMNITKELTPDSGVLGPETYSTSQHPIKLDRTGQQDKGGYEASRFRYDRAKASGKGLEAARQEFEGYSDGTQVQLHGGSATGNVITTGIVAGGAKIPVAKETAMKPGLIESGVNVPHRTSQGLSADPVVARKQADFVRDFTTQAGGLASRLTSPDGVKVLAKGPEDYSSIKAYVDRGGTAQTYAEAKTKLGNTPESYAAAFGMGDDATNPPSQITPPSAPPVDIAPQRDRK